MQRRGVSSAKVNIQGGDGLAVKRLLEVIAADPITFLDTTPAVVPMLGEYPHGLHHIMHTAHRNFKPFVMRCAKETGNIAIVEDPAEVKYFNSHMYFHWKLTRACAEYLYEISRSPGGLDFEDVPSFFRAVEANIDLAWVAHYAYDAGFLMLDFKQALRANQSDVLDQDWCEFLTLARTGTGHKTTYGILALMQVYRSVTLHPKLAELWRTVRTLPMSKNPGARVGHDSPCEWLHADITASVQTHVTEATIEKFITTRPFTTTVERELRSLLGTESDSSANKLKAMDEDVKKLLKLFRSEIGATWAAATSANAVSKLKMQSRSQTTPWAEYEAVASQKGNDSTASYVRRHLSTYAFQHEWQP